MARLPAKPRGNKHPSEDDAGPNIARHDQPRDASSMNRLAAGALAFVSSAGVLVLEILAGRLLAPYVGITLETYTAVIGTVLAGIAVGAWLGGVLADRVDARKLLGPLLILGGALGMASVAIVRSIGADATSGSASDAVVLVAAGFFLPAVVLSAVPPTIVKLQLGSLDKTGSTVGSLSALSTAGGLFGTFITGFFLVGRFTTTSVVIGVGALLCGLGVICWIALRPLSGPVTTLIVPLLAAVSGVGAASQVDSPCERETEYVCARVEDGALGISSGRLLLLDDVTHSYVDLADDRLLEFSYTKVFGAVVDEAAPPDQPVRVVHLGGGGFTLPRYVRSTRPGSPQVVLERDPGLVRLVEDRMGWTSGPDVKVLGGDGRTSMASLPKGSQDVILGDAFGSLAVPWHLTTFEFTETIRTRLRPGGVYALNVIDGVGQRFIRAEVATVAAVFRYVAIVTSPSAWNQESSDNFVVIASDEPLPLAGLAQRVGASDLVVGTLEDLKVDDSTVVLRDDFAPVDQLFEP